MIKQIGTLYRYEMKKIFRRKIVWITTGVMLAVSILISLNSILVSSYSIDGKAVSGYEMAMQEREGERTLAGRAIDQELLDEIRAAKEGEPAYRSLRNWWLPHILNKDLDAALEVTTEPELYQQWKRVFVERQEANDINSDEKDYWEERLEEVEIPFVFDYTRGYEAVGNAHILNLMMALAAGICLAGVFAGEHQRRTDQIILSSRYGRRQAYLAKILAAQTFGFMMVVLTFTGVYLPGLCVFGFDGFSAPLQLILPFTTWFMTIGEATLILFGIYAAIGVLYSAIVCLLSEWTRNSVAAMAIIVGGVILTLFLNIPTGLASRIYSLIPTVVLGERGMHDGRLITVMGEKLLNYQFVPWLYLVVAVLMITAGGFIYRKYQVRGR